ncbi:MAG: DegV family protein [Clostridia bacterium]|nr:DegV family protein [Clostridia bacterium]
MEIKRKVMCTSTGCIEYAPERYRKYDIDIIRIHVNFKGREYLEGLDLDPVAFYRELETLEDPKNNLPYTAMPTREAIMGHFEKAYAEGYREVIVIALSAYLGGTYNLIRLIAEEFADRMKITVIDSKITCFGEGLLAIKAAEMIEAGIPTDTIIKELHWMMKHQEFLGVDGKLDYLIYNGRLKGGKALMGKMLSICPVVHFTHEGELCALQSVRTPKKALHKTCEVLKELIGDRAPEDYLLWHVYTGTALLEDLIEIEKAYGIETNHEAVIVSPVSGCHNGPWLAGYGLAFLRREDEPLEEDGV